MAMIEKIKAKADKVNLQTKLTTRKYESLQEDVKDRTELFIQIPNERDFKTIVVDKDHRDLAIIEKSNFEKYKFIKGLEAIYSSELGLIECQIQSEDGFGTGGMYVLRRLSRFVKPRLETNSGQLQVFKMDENEAAREDNTITFPSPAEGVSIKLMSSSAEFSFLSGSRLDRYLSRRELVPFAVVKLEGLKFATHNEAKDLLNNIANSVFFQIDLLTNIPIRLASDKDLQRHIRLRRKAVKRDLKFVEPKFQYDNEAISLYWYARTTVNTPLLSFLAFYQVLEFYFPQYSAKEARERIKNLLKDPTFDRNSDKNISKILDIVKASSKGKAIGDERSQIKATITSCLDTTDLLDFFDEIEERKDFFDDSKRGKSLVTQKISFNRKDHDIRIDIAIRIYELRCRIVHTKEEEDMELLLPYSSDLALIKYDIELIEYVARKVLIAGCKPLDLKGL